MRIHVVAVTSLLFTLVLNGCEKPSLRQTEVPDSPVAESETSSRSQTESAESFPLYSTLPGKMARMEELLNGIGRLLDAPDFQDRLVADASEFHELLIECRGLYPKRLSIQDRPKFDETINQTAVVARELLAALQKNRRETARDALNQLDQQRLDGHNRFSY